MKKLMLAVALAILATGSAVASEKGDVLATVHQFVDGFNKGDIKAALAVCADDASVVDDFPPHEWHGPGTCAKWAADFDADAARNGITDGFVTLHKPLRVDVTGDRAYTVFPATYKYKMKGKKVNETGATMTLALQKEAGGWRIKGWAWSRH